MLSLIAFSNAFRKKLHPELVLKFYYASREAQKQKNWGIKKSTSKTSQNTFQ